MALTPVSSDGDGGRLPVFDGELNEHWTIGPKVHGGAMLALCANAARTALGGRSEGVEPDRGVGQLPVGAGPGRAAAW